MRTRGVRPSDLAGKAGEIAGVLEHRLVSGKYRFGETLSIYTLAEQFDASRQPVAAAVVYLRSIGYLEVIPQVGCRVVSPSAQEVIDFYRMYSKVESVISGLAAQRHEGNEAAQLVDLAERLAASPFQTDQERWTYGEGVTEFHKLTGAMARSVTLVGRISSLRRISRFYLWQGKSVRNPDPDTTEYMNRSRLQIAHAIAERDSDAAERLTEDHIRANPGWVGIV
jgi:DNA-binding GntR family transcriptional regulator